MRRVLREPFSNPALISSREILQQGATYLDTPLRGGARWLSSVNYNWTVMTRRTPRPPEIFAGSWERKLQSARSGAINESRTSSETFAARNKSRHWERVR